MARTVQYLPEQLGYRVTIVLVLLLVLDGDVRRVADDYVVAADAEDVDGLLVVVDVFGDVGVGSWLPKQV